MKNKSNILTVVLAILLLAAVIVVLVMAVKWPKESVDTSADTDEVQAVETGEIPDIPEETDPPEEPKEMMDITTPYCTVQYPKMWQDNLKYTETEENGIYTQTLYCVLGDSEIEMFSIHFGSEDIGTVIGHLLIDGQSVPFSVSSVDIGDTSYLSEGDQSILDSMCFAVNDIIKSVEAQENFIV